MGRIGLPDISKVEEVLELITNQDKYVKYMQDITEAFKAARAALGDLKTKEQADEYLAKAEEKFNASVVSEAQAKKRSVDADANIRSNREKLVADQKEWNAKYAEELQLTEHANQLLYDKQVAFDAYVTDKALALDELTKSLAKQQDKLTEEGAKVAILKEKFEKAAAALA